MHHGPPRAVDSDPVAGHRAVAREQEDHLETRKRAHHRAVRRAESRQALRCHEREIHARLEHEAVLRGAVDEVALRVTHIVGDVARVLAYENERGVTGETVAELRQASREGGPEQQGGRPDRASRAHHGPRPDPILPRRPLGWAALRPRRSRSDPDEKRAVAADPDDLRPRHDLHSLALGARQLHPVRALLRLVRATEVAQARPAAALHIDGELLDSESGLPSPLDEQPVVVVDEGVFEQVDAVLRGEPLRAGHDVGVIEAGDAPAPDHTLGRGERGAGVDDGGAAVHGGERQGHGAVGREKSARVSIQCRGHLELPPGELGVAQARPLFEHHDPPAVTHQRRALLRDSPAPGTRADDHHVVATLCRLAHRRTSQPRGSAR